MSFHTGFLYLDDVQWSQKNEGITKIGPPIHDDAVGESRIYGGPDFYEGCPDCSCLHVSKACGRAESGSFINDVQYKVLILLKGYIEQIKVGPPFESC